MKIYKSEPKYKFQQADKKNRVDNKINNIKCIRDEKYYISEE